MQRQLQGLGRHETVDTAHGDSLFSEDLEISSSERLRRFETNAVGACFVAVTAISMDALSAIPTVVVKSTPSSLRCTAMVLIFCLGAPIVSPTAADVDLTWQQRGLAAIGLIIVAALGEHASEADVRITDAVFVLISGWAAVFLFVFKSRKVAPGSALFGALLTYIGARAVRAGLVHSAEARAFSVSGDSYNTQGYALSDTTAAVAIVFAGAMLACTGIVVLLNTNLISAVGSHAVSPTVSMSTGCAFAAVFVAQLSIYSMIENLPALFGPSACAGGRSVCEAAFRARRFYISNSSPASLWAGIVAATIFSLPKSRRCPTRRNYFNESRLSTASGAVAALVSAVAVVASFVFASESMVVVQLEIILLYAAIPTAWFISTPIACVLSIAGHLLYMGENLDGPFGYDLTFFTHWSLLATLILTFVICITTGISRALYLFSPPLTSPAVETVTGVALAAATSIQFALTLATLGLIVGYDGSFLSTSTGSWSSQGFSFTVQHSLSFFFLAAVTGSRYELGDPLIAIGSPKVPIPLLYRRIAWFAAPPLIGAFWTITLLATNNPSPYDEFTGFGSLFVALTGAFVPWVVVGLVI